MFSYHSPPVQCVSILFVATFTQMLFLVLFCFSSCLHAYVIYLSILKFNVLTVYKKFW